MTLDLQPKLVSLGELIQNRLFRIPDYQRTYSWEKGQRDALFADIRQAHDKGPERTHFMATIVGLRREQRTIGTDVHSEVEVVDGQQRITTLLILLKAVAKAVANATGPSKADRALKKEIESALVKDDRATLLLLQTNHDTSDHFKNYMRRGTHPDSSSASTVADREILAAIEGCERFVADWRRNGLSLVELVRLLKNRLAFILYEVGDEALVYTVFEVLNSRGLPVSWFDRLKSMLMANIFESDSSSKDEIIREVHTSWTDIYRCVGLRLWQSTESMRAAATLRSDNRPSRMLGEEDAAMRLSQQSLRAEDVIDTTNWLKDVTFALDAVERNQRISGVTNIAQARMVAAAINIRDELTPADKDFVLQKWERVTFRVYGLHGEDARKRVGDYVRLAWDIIKKAPSADEIITRLTTIGADFPIDQVVSNLAEDCYNDWGRQLLYFFRRYEERLAEDIHLNSEQWNRIWEKSPTDSIEHIRPQSLWVDDEYSKTIHSIGNLMILTPGLNSRLQDKPVKEKAAAYRETGLLLAREVADLVEQKSIESHWTMDAIKEREQSLMEWARQEWAD